jgi:bifunctional DNA-binding transcriptional regulator/antitoxin component of YhaV-PrlF toxin-antitoxin module
MMRRLSLLLCFSLLACTLPRALGQSDDANQKKAKATIDAMVKALGGEQWLSTTSLVSEGRTSGFYQGKPTGATAVFYQVEKFPDETRTELGKKRDVVEIFADDDAWEVTYKGSKEIPKEQLEELRRRRDHTIRTVVTHWLKDPRTILIYGGQSLVERHLTDQTTIINANNDSVTIQTDADTHLPLARSYQWRDPLYKDKNTDSEEYEDYHLASGLPVPFTVTRYHNGDMTNQRFLTRAEYNVPLAPDLFNPDQAAARIKK